MRLRQLAAATTIAALAFTLVGCKSSSTGTGGQGTASGGTSKKFAPLTLTPTQVVSASAVKTLGARSARMSMTITATSSATAKTTIINADGAIDFANHRGTMVLHFPSLGDIQAIFDKGVIYEKLGQLLPSQSGGKPWIKIDLTQLLGKNATALGSLSQGSSDPSQSLAYLFGASGVTKIGSDSVRGVATTHYTGKLDLTRATQRLTPQFRALYQRALQQLGGSVSSLPADLWIDGQGRLRRMSYTLKLATSTTKNTIDYFAFGTPVSVQLPPADQVTSLGG